ncbi:MAG: sterol desaturase family protein [Pseudomonadota bacterium]
MFEFQQNAGAFLILAIAIVLGEMLWRRSSRRSYDFGALGATLAIYAGQILASAVTASVVVLVWRAAYELAPIQWDDSDWRVWLACFFLVELVYYWEHRLSHTVRWLWATHAVHHSPNELVLPAAFRLGWTGLVSGGWLFFTTVAFVGFPPFMIALWLVGGLRYQFFLHTEYVGRLGPLEWILNTPSNHRVHHSSRQEHVDKNFGSVFMVFDHLFGTYAGEKTGTDMCYGLTDPIRSNNPFRIAFREWKRMAKDVLAADSPARAMGAAFGRPRHARPPAPGEHSARARRCTLSRS